MSTQNLEHGPRSSFAEVQNKKLPDFLEQISLTVVTKHPHYISMKYNVHSKNMFINILISSNKEPFCQIIFLSQEGLYFLELLGI